MFLWGRPRRSPQARPLFHCRAVRERAPHSLHTADHSREDVACGEVSVRGALPGLDLIELDEYLAALKRLDISVQADPVDA